jgi:hypothetical protein
MMVRAGGKNNGFPFSLFIFWFFLLVASILWFHREGDRMVGGDGQKYYEYCRALGLHGDLDYHPDFAAEAAGSQDWSSGKLSLPFSVGPALVWLPLFECCVLGERLLGPWTGGRNVDGTDPFTEEAVCITTIFFVFIGLWFLTAELSRAGNEPWICGAALVGIYGATFLLNYTVFEPSMAHGLAFAFSSFFLVAWLRWRQNPSSLKFFYLGVLLGCAALMRYTSVLLAALPLMELLIAKTSKRWWVASLAAGAALGFAPQIFVWWTVFGKALLVPQGGGFMHYCHPYLLEILWSPAHGLFSSHPMILVGILGFLWGFRKDRELFWGFLAFFFALTWVNASAGDWYGGWAFGARRFESVLPFAFLGLPTALEGVSWIFASRKARVAAIVAAVLCWNILLLNMFRKHTNRRGGSVRPAELVEWATSRYGRPWDFPADYFLARKEHISAGQADALLGDYLDLRDDRQNYIEPLVDKGNVLGGFDGAVVRAPSGLLQLMNFDNASLGFSLWNPGPLSELELLPDAPVGGLRFQGALLVNGTRVFEGDVVPGQAIRVPLPNGLLREGINVVEADVNGGHDRMGIRWFSMR